MADIHGRDGLPLAAALAALPLESPEASAWPALASRLARQPIRRRPTRAWSVAVAAGLIALALAPRGWLGADAPSSPALAAGATAPQPLAALMSESARLERLVAAASEAGASSGTAAVVSLQVEDRLRSVDAELQSGPAPARQLALWQQRVELMRDIAAFETSRHYLASRGEQFDLALVAAY